ncbi:tellurite resistance protein [Sulfurivirga caldicuralii]|uniref:Tellurite resistance protein n=1 Tax=Sulfurivirga caldicuralii TaxID=364032 RepID=A0A1N6F9Z9_9GAMM|nr:SLAC1 anion channel family protein [Sulfurivirga caldicuralii]SIN92067.1 tellurite resistance protein [Sulfurivirga caldicuralii]
MSEQASTPQVGRLVFFPVNLFGAVMGYMGMTLGYYLTAQLFAFPATVFSALLAVSTALFALLSVIYLIKIIKYPQFMVKEFNHPIAINFFPTISISLILLGSGYMHLAPEVGYWFWLIGTSMQLILTLVIMNLWIHHEKWQIEHLNPAWFIPVVGNVIVPMAAPEYAGAEIGWFFFSIGVVFWIILQAVIFYRLFFHPPVDRVLMPTLFIMIAPPAMAFLSYVHLTGQVDALARIFYYVALFISLLLLVQAPRFFRIPFAISWWAYTFPVAAIANASFVMFAQTAEVTFAYIGAFFLSLVTVLIAHLTAKTLWAAKNRKLCVPPPQPVVEEPSA